jgi:hypothetical protein
VMSSLRSPASSDPAARIKVAKSALFFMDL